MSLYELLGSLETGFIFGIVALGAYLTFQILDFPDLTVEGSFPLGAAVAATLIVGAGLNPWAATLAGGLAGFCAGFVTAFLNVRFKHPAHPCRHPGGDLALFDQSADHGRAATSRS